MYVYLIPDNIYILEVNINYMDLTSRDERMERSLPEVSWRDHVLFGLAMVVLVAGIILIGR